MVHAPILSKLKPLILTILLLGFGLRVYRLEAQSLWYDEGVSWMLSQADSLTSVLSWTAADIQPPFYYLVLWLTTRFLGDSEFALRLPSVWAGMLLLPLIYTLARRLAKNALGSRAETKSLLALLMTAVAPVMVYYSQEARMYTLVVTLVTLASYLWLRIRDKQIDLSGLEVAYVGAMTLAIYTHYFACFVLVAHGVHGLYLWHKSGFRSVMFVRFAGLLGGVLVLFGPWLPILLGRLGDDPSYWTGSLKVDEVFRKLWISFIVGETVHEAIGVWLSGGFLSIFLLLFLWQQLTTRQRTIHRDVFLSLWLFIPLAGILTLAVISPKFNPRYTLLAWPAFVLWLASVAHSKRSIKPLGAGILTIVYLILAGYSLTNGYTDREFAKDDWRALAQFVSERRAEDETVLLVSGHAFPVWDYYADNDDWTALPRGMERLDVSQVLTLDVRAQIAHAVDGHGGVWLVNWQDEVIDPNGVVPFWLDWAGVRPRDAGDFWGIRLEHWRLTKPERLTESAIDQPQKWNFANKLSLLGFTQLSDDELALFWQAHELLPDDISLTLELSDRDGFGWHTERQTLPLGATTYPPKRWAVGETIITRHRLPWQIGTPPGRYFVEIELGQANADGYEGWDTLDEQGRPQRRTALLDPVRRRTLHRPADAPLPIASDPQIDFLPIVSVRKLILSQEQAEPGDRLRLILLWQAGEFNYDDLEIGFELIDSAGISHSVGGARTPSRQFSLPQWQPGDLVLGQYWLDIPTTASAGPAQLKLHLINRYGFAYDEQFPLTELELLPTERNFDPPPPLDLATEANFSDHVQLLGLTCEPSCHLQRGQTTTLTLYWQGGLVRFAENYTVFAHLLGEAETVLINADHAPPKATRLWVNGELIADPFTFDIPPDLAPGDYLLEVGLYNADDPAFTRLSRLNGATRVLFTLTVP